MNNLTNQDFINADGSYNVAAIMAVAHRKARHGFNTSLIVLSGTVARPTLSQAETVYARIAATIDRRTLTVPACLSYAAEFQTALLNCWWQASVMRRRHVPVVVVPVFFKLAA